MAIGAESNRAINKLVKSDLDLNTVPRSFRRGVWNA